MKINLLKKRLIILSLSLATTSINAQNNTGYISRINTINTNIYKYFFDSSKNRFNEKINFTTGVKNQSYLWPICGLLQAANEMDVTENKKENFTKVFQYTEDYRADKNGNRAYKASATDKSANAERYFDDNQWVALALIDAYTYSSNKEYLQNAESNYRFLLTGYDTVSGGGIYWKENSKKSKNTCSNGPMIVLALKLYNATKQQNYLDTALLIYNWVNKNLRTENGLFYDNIKLPSLKIDKRLFSYNCGTMLESNVLLYKITNDNKYLIEAKIIADAANAHFFAKGEMSGLYWFDAVLLRGLEQLYLITKNKSLLTPIIAAADNVWNNRNEQNLVGNKPEKELLQQAAMLEIFARLSRLNK